MNTVEDGKKFIDVGTHVLNSEIISLSEASGHATSEDIFAPIDFPDFEQAAMDGYGVYLAGGKQPENFEIKGEEQAGNITIQNKIKPGEAIRIFTGAKIPEGVNTVIQQEWVEKKGNLISILDFKVVEGMNIRPKGSQTKKGELVLKKGSPLFPAAVSLLASLGFAKINVTRKPRIIIINTGKELVPPGDAIKPGQVYESNSYSLQQALYTMHIKPFEISTIDDDKAALIKKFEEVIPKCDLLLITGGVSVGDYDFVVEALAANQVNQLFHKLAQKPGKPLYFGKKEHTLVFGLPGNPASVLTSYYLFVMPCIKKMMGFAESELKKIRFPLLNSYSKKPGLTHFVKGKLHESGVELLSNQESYKMNSFALADVIVEIEAETTDLPINELVIVHILPV